MNLRYYKSETETLVKCAKDMQKEHHNFPNLFYVSGWTWLQIASFLINPKSYRDQTFNLENQHIDEAQNHSKTGIEEFLKENSAVNSDKFQTQEGSISVVVKDMVYNMIISSLRRQDQYGLFYSHEFTKDLSQELV